MRKISFIMPSRNGLKYLKWSYDSLRKNCSKLHEICMYDDFSNDGTWEWMKEIKEKDPNVQIYRNDGPTRLGHTILYDELIEKATNDIVMIWHNDMYAAKGMDKEVLSLLKPKTVVSVTRVEPPLHPEGPEKLVMNFGTEPEEFMEDRFLKYADDKGTYNIGDTQGMFAPWAIYKEDFLAIGGHDPLYAPQSREDSDIFNRFLLAEYKPVQTWDTFVYHMTCRGSRFNPQITQVGQASAEWLDHNKKSERNFIRKWGSSVNHDTKLRPIISAKYDISFIVNNIDGLNQIYHLEPRCSKLYVDCNQDMIDEYIEIEQKNTTYCNLNEKIFYFSNVNDIDVENISDIVIVFDAETLPAMPDRFQNTLNFSTIPLLIVDGKTIPVPIWALSLFVKKEELAKIPNLDYYLNEKTIKLSIICNFPFIIENEKLINEEIGEHEYKMGNTTFDIKINKIKHYENENKYCDKSKIKRIVGEIV